MNDTKKTKFILGIGLLFLFSVFISLFLGATRISLSALLKNGIFSGADSNDAAIFRYVRLPRTAAALVSGACLAVSGALLQTLLNNALAGPNIIGVNAGANLATLLVMALIPGWGFLQPMAAFCGAVLCTGLIYWISVKTGGSRLTIILSGVAVSGIITAISGLIKIFFPEILYAYNMYSIGSISNADLSVTGFALPYALVGIVLSVLLAGRMNVLSLGEETAVSLGLNIKQTRIVLVILASVLAGAAVSVAGTLGFVGLLAPHAVRRLVGFDNRVVIPCSALFGAALVLLCDTFGRVVFAPFEIPVGILLSILGGSYFLFLLFYRKRGKLYD